MSGTDKPIPETPGMEWSELNPVRPKPTSLRKRRAVLVTALLGAVVAVVLLIPTTRLYLLGALNREPYFEGWPSRWWAAQLRDPDPGRNETIQRLARGGEKVLPVLTRLLEDSDVEVRVGAAEAASAIAPVPDGAIPLLVKGLGDADLRVRIQAVRGIDQIAPNGQEAIPLLVAIVQELNRDSEAQKDAIDAVTSALARYGPAAKAATTPLLELLPTDSLSSSVAIYGCLTAIDPALMERTLLRNDWGASPLMKVQFVGDTRDLILRVPGGLHLRRGGKWVKVPLPGGVADFSVLPDGRSLVALLDSDSKRLLVRRPLLSGDGPNVPEWQIVHEASYLSVRADGQLVVTASASGKLSAFDVATGLQVEGVKLPSASSWYALAFSSQGRDLAVGGSLRLGGEYKVFLIDTGTGNVRWEHHTKWMPSNIALAGDGTVLAAFHLGNQVHIWDGKTRRETSITTECEQVCNIVTCKGGSVLAATTAKDSCTVGLWNLRSGAPVGELHWHRRHPRANVDIVALAVSRDGTCLASLDSDGWIRFWDLGDSEAERN